MTPTEDSVLHLFSLEGRTAAVTGGAGPLGSVISHTLAELGATVIVVDVDADSCDRALESLSPGGAGHSCVVADLRDPEATSSVRDHVESHHGRLDVLVNNAAFTGSSGIPGYAVPFAEQTAEAFSAASDLNLRAPFLLAQALAPLLGASGQGVILNVSSIYGVVAPNMNLYSGTAMGNPAAYGATKAGLAHLTRYLATVLAPEIRVNAIAPGGIARGQDSAFVERYESLTPLGRMANEEDFRGAIAWLCSSASAYVTGQVIPIDGGWTTW